MAETVTMPKLGFDMAEGTLVRWVIAEGEAVTKGAILAEIETDKATVEVESVYDGLLARQLVAEGDVVPVNTPIAIIAAPGEQIEEGVKISIEKAAPVPKSAPEAGPSGALPQAPAEAVVAEAVVTEGVLPGGVKASPLARRLAEERGVSLSAVAGSGTGGRITKKDVEAFIAAPAILALPQIAPAPAVQPGLPSFPSTTVPLKRLRAIIGRRMTEAKQRVPHFYVTHEYDMAALLDLRRQVNLTLPDEEKVSVNDFVIKAAALTLREFPNLNASLDESNNQVIQHGGVNIGVAVAVEGGLLTVDRKSVV